MSGALYEDDPATARVRDIVSDLIDAVSDSVHVASEAQEALTRVLLVLDEHQVLPAASAAEVMQAELQAKAVAAQEVPFIAFASGEQPVAHLSLDCPVCGEGPLPLKDSDPPMLQFISHCGKSWLRGRVTAS